MNTLLGAGQNSDTLLTSNPQPKVEHITKPKAESCDYTPLIKEHFLSEFITKSDKDKVRKNLGLDYKVNWGEIGGIIESQTDLQRIIKDCILKETDNKTAVEQILYKNSAYPNIKTLKDALDKVLYADLTISISVNPNIVEKGTSIDGATLTWSYNKSNIKQQTLDGEQINIDLREYTILGPITESIAKTVRGNDGTKSVTGAATIYFYPGIYYGTNSVQPNISTLTKQLKPSRVCNITVNAKDSEYIWIFLPNNYGIPTFTVGGFSGGFEKVSQLTYNTTLYDVWRSDNVNLGNTVINIT